MTRAEQRSAKSLRRWGHGAEYGAWWCAILMVAACATLEPHENFRRSLNYRIGTRVDEPAPFYTWTNNDRSMETRELAGGRRENVYAYRGQCVYVFEYDVESRVITSARIERGAADCFMNP